MAPARRWPPLLRPGNAGSNTTADPIELLDAALAGLPAVEVEWRHRARARAEDRIRALNQLGMANLACGDFARNAAWLHLTLITLNLLAWTQALTPHPRRARGADRRRARRVHCGHRVGDGGPPAPFRVPAGVAVTAMEPALRSRFPSAVTAEVGRNRASINAHPLPRVPVRASDLVEFFAAKLAGRLIPERTYNTVVAVAKRAGVPA
jgi:hypothetical protein